MGMGIDDMRRLGPRAQHQIAQQLEQQHAAELARPKTPVPKRNKYGAEKTEANGIKFDSRKEAARYQELMVLLKAGKIRDLRLQQEYVLQPAYTTPEGERVRSIRYVADFTYEEIGSWPETVWVRVVEDVKSEATRKNRVYQMKRKMMKDHGYTIREV